MRQRATLAVVVLAALGGGAIATVLVLRGGSSGSVEPHLPGASAFPPAERHALRDYGKIVFQAGTGGTLQTEGGERTEPADVYVVNTDGSGLRNLTANSPKDVDPVWSPDGHRIAFASWRHGGADIYTMNQDGSGVKRLTRLPGDEVAPLWSYDGKKIAFIVPTHDVYVEVWVANADGTGPNRLLADARRPLSWSPDGRLAAISADGTLLALRPDGSNPIRLADAEALNADLAWSPDGRVILYEFGRGLDSALYFLVRGPGATAGGRFPWTAIAQFGRRTASGWLSRTRARAAVDSLSFALTARRSASSSTAAPWAIGRPMVYGSRSASTGTGRRARRPWRS